MSRKTLIQFAHLSEQIACFIHLFAGQIMTSIVIQFVRLVAPLTSLENVVSYNWKVICLKMILLSWLFKVLWN